MGAQEARDGGVSLCIYIGFGADRPETEGAIASFIMAASNRGWVVVESLAEPTIIALKVLRFFFINLVTRRNRPNQIIHYDEFLSSSSSSCPPSPINVLSPTNIFICVYTNTILHQHPLIRWPAHDWGKQQQQRPGQYRSLSIAPGGIETTETFHNPTNQRSHLPQNGHYNRIWRISPSAKCSGAVGWLLEGRNGGCVCGCSQSTQKHN